VKLFTARSLVVTAAATALLTGGVGSALATSTPTRTALTISAKSTGMSTVAQPVSGVLKAGTTPLGKQVVRLVGRLAGSTSFKTLRYGTTDAKGAVTFSVKPPKGHDVYELVYNGSHRSSPSYAGTHSNTLTITASK
jgi:hypothetical protein